MGRFMSMGGQVVGHLIGHLQNRQAQTNRDATERASVSGMSQSTGDIYSEAMSDSTATSPILSPNTNVNTAGQGSQFGADCVSRQLARKGGAGASMKDVRNAEKFCGGSKTMITRGGRK